MENNNDLVNYVVCRIRALYQFVLRTYSFL